MEQKLLDIGTQAVQQAERFGAKQAEAYLSSFRSFSIDVENSSIKQASEKLDAGCGIRSVVDKRIGFSYVTSVLEKDIVNVANTSVQLAKASVPDPDFVSLPSYTGEYKSVEGIFDPNLQNLESEVVANLIIRAVDATKEGISKDYKTAIEARITLNVGTRAIINSLGISGIEESTYLSLYSFPVVKYDETQTSSFEYQISRNLKEIDPEWVGKGAAKNVLRSFNPKIVENAEMKVLLTPLAVGTIMGFGFGRAINAEEIQYGRSYISDALGDTIASDNLTIVDDGLKSGGVKSRFFDAEGYPSQQTEVLSSGVLKGILHNSYTANKDNVDNTGNASRLSYSGVPTITPSNFVISPDKGSQDDLIAEIDKGILCRNTGDRPNMTTGDLSAMVMEGFYIENGEIKYPVKNTLFGINMRDLLKKIDENNSTFF